MLTVFRKEITGFFSSLIGYIVIGVFLVIIGVFMWVFKEYSVLDFGYANMDTLFSMAPWVFLFLIPAITMRMFSEERKNNTVELLYTKPVTEIQIILGKYLAGVVLVLFALIPTIIYYISVYRLADPVGNIDVGSILGSYIGLILLASCFTAIGLFSSSVTENQVVAFILGVFFCAFFYIAFSSLSLLADGSNTWMAIIQQLGIDEHYNSISRGVVDTRDVIYFLSLNTLFILLTKTVVESRKW